MPVNVRVSEAENGGNHVIVIVPKSTLSEDFKNDLKGLEEKFKEALGNPILSAAPSVTVDVKVYPK
ncbi:MAG TPA: hypothetical protein VFG53_14700 [Anaeromyxobacter sp.]|nr:hypothetical protein [Anaeromyxobacter sp.]